MALGACFIRNLVRQEKINPSFCLLRLLALFRVFLVFFFLFGVEFTVMIITSRAGTELTPTCVYVEK